MTPADDTAPRIDPRAGRRFTLVVALCAVFLAALPWLVALAITPPGGLTLGFPIAADDQMVYAGWMTQAAEGKWLFENRFTTAPQPGLTFHAYFLVLGWISKVFGVVATLHLARLAMSFVFVLALMRFLRRLPWDFSTVKLALGVALVAGGIGFLVWHDFGNAIVRPESQFLAGPLQSKLPIDVWQTEAFVFPSMLANGLFMAALSLMLVIFTAFLDAERSSRRWWIGGLATLLLMNIHSYDVLIVLGVAIGLAVAAMRSGRFSGAWAGRVALMGACAIPAALWFLYVLREDAVFQARAATPTFSAAPRALIAGLLPVLSLGLLAVARRGRGPLIAAAMMGGILALLATAPLTPDAFLLGWPLWAGLFVAALAATALAATGRPALDLVTAWAFVGLVLPYLPQLLQRKLAAGLVIPWAILAVEGLSALVAVIPAGSRRLPLALASLVLGASSVRWFARDLQLVRANTANTTVQPIWLDAATRKIVEAVPPGAVVVAPPGIPSGELDEGGGTLPDRFGPPILPDLNPILVGLRGAKAPAGHWSETPDYGRQRARATTLFFKPSVLGIAEKPVTALDTLGATHIIVPTPDAYPQLTIRQFPDATVVAEHGPWRLLKL